MPPIVAVAAEPAVDRAADHPREHDHEGVEHALQQRHGHHVAVGDVADLVREHRLGLVALIARSSPVDTATSALLRLAPVAKALISGAS
jgi:hypothetical protein